MRENPVVNSQRSIGLDLLKVVAMLMVVALHVLGHGGVLEATEVFSTNYEIAWLLESFAYCAVDIYVVITGYLYADRKVRISRIVMLWFTALFYSVLISTGLFFLRPYVGYITVVKGFFPLISKQYWFFNAYFALFCFIPVLNLVAAEKQRLKCILMISAFLFVLLPLLGLQRDLFNTSKGSSFLWFTVLYSCGAYLKKTDLPLKMKSKNLMWGTYFASAVLMLISRNILILVTDTLRGQVSYADLFYAYTSPFVCISAICLFVVFANLPVKTGRLQNVVEAFAPYTFGVYLIHDNPLFREWIIKDRFSPLAELSPIKMFLCIMTAVLVIYLGCTLIDFLRARLFKALHVEKAAKEIERIIKEQTMIWIR